MAIAVLSAAGAGGLTDAAELVGPITIVSHIDVIPDAYLAQAEEKAAALFQAEIGATQKDAGLVSYVVLRQVNGSNHFTIVETWADSKAYAAHVGSAHTIAFRKDVQDYLGSPFDARVHQVFR